MRKRFGEELVVRRGPDRAPRMPKVVSGTTKVEMSDLEKSQQRLAKEEIEVSSSGCGFIRS